MRALLTRLRDDRKREKVLVEDFPDPGSPSGNQVRTGTVYSGLTNGTERNDLLRGNYAHADEELPAGCGYQNVGEIIEIGADVRHLSIGDLLYMSRDHMEFCLEPEDGLHVMLLGEVEPTDAALFGMASVAMRSCRHAELHIGDKFLIVGAGFIGQVAAQIANVMGARVTLCDIDDRRLTTARQIGAAEDVIDVSDNSWDQHIRNADFSAVLDVAGVPGMEDRIIDAVQKRGTVLFIAGRDKVEYTFNLGQDHEIMIKQNNHFDKSDLDNLFRLVRRGLVRITPLIQDTLPVSQAKRVYDTLVDEPTKLLGTVFDWSKTQ